MSRIGRLPVKLADGVSFEMKDRVVVIKGKLGELSQAIENDNINVELKDGMVFVTRTSEDKRAKSAHGLYRALIANMVKGVSEGYAVALEIAGVGYKVQLSGKDLILNVGYSHPVNVKAPEGVTFEVPDITNIVVKGIDKCLVGQTAANIRAIRKPEPYHAYGIHYKDEVIVRKEGKSAGK